MAPLAAIARAPSQSKPSVSSVKGTVAGKRSSPMRLFLIWSAWTALAVATALSLTYSVRIYVALTSASVPPGGGKGDSMAAGGGAGNTLRRASLMKDESSGKNGEGGEGDDYDDGEEDYALLYPNPDCVGHPIRIPYETSSETRCRHCRDFCSVRFDDAKNTDETANLVRWKSMFVFGRKNVEVLTTCVGTYSYSSENVCNVLKVGDGCQNLDVGASHARFVVSAAAATSQS